MKKSIVCFCCLIAVKFSYAQQLNISGSVRDEKKNVIPLVSVIVEKQKNGMATDSSGNFNLSVPKYSKITFSAVGYKDTVVIIENESPLKIVLKYSEKQLDTVTVVDSRRQYQINNQLKNEMVQADFLHYKMENNLSSGINTYEGNGIVNDRIVPYHVNTINSSSGIYQGSAFPEFHSKEDTKGSPYLFDTWYKGIVAEKSNNNLLDDSKNFYNIDKIAGNLVMTRDFISALNVDKSQVNFFTLYDSLKNSHSFTIVPSINPALFCEVVALSNDYDVFKLTTCKFKKADFHSDGIASTGNNYDEYVNTVTYYLFDVKNSSYKTIMLKKKNIIAAFENNEKVNKYFLAHKENIDDRFLKSLIKYVDEDN